MAKSPLETCTDYAKKSSIVCGAQTHHFVMLVGPTLFYTRIIRNLIFRGAKSDFEVCIVFLIHERKKYIFFICFALFHYSSVVALQPFKKQNLKALTKTQDTASQRS